MCEQQPRLPPGQLPESCPWTAGSASFPSTGLTGQAQSPTPLSSPARFPAARMGDVGGPSATSLVRKARGTAVYKPAGEQYSGHMVTELEVGPGKDSPVLCLFHEEK